MGMGQLVVVNGVAQTRSRPEWSGPKETVCTPITASGPKPSVLRGTHWGHLLRGLALSQGKEGHCKLLVRSEAEMTD